MPGAFSEYEQTSHDKPHFTPVSIAVVLAVVIGLSGFFFYQLQRNKNPRYNYSQLSLEVLGLANPTSNRLDPAFTDADHDLVADPPDDPAKLRRPDVLRIALPPNVSHTSEPAPWQPLLDALTQATGRRVEYVACEDAAKRMQAMRDGQLHVALFTSNDVPRAVNAAGFVPAVTPALAGKPCSYRVAFVTRPDASIDHLNDLQGKLVGMSRYGSGAGFKAPLVILYKQFGLQPMLDFDVALSVTCEQSLKSLMKYTYDAVAVRSDLFEDVKTRSTFATSQLKVLHTSAALPLTAVGYAHDLDPALAQQIVDTLLSTQLVGIALGDSDATQDADGFTPVSFEEDFGFFRQIDDTVGKQHQLDQAPAK